MNNPQPTPARPMEFVSWSRDRWMFDDGLVLLMYHKIAPAPLATSLPALYVTGRDFTRQMDELTAAGLG